MVGGGALLALNFRRLGMRQRVVPTIALFAVLQVVLFGIVLFFTARGVTKDDDVRRALRFGGNLLAVVLAVPFIRAQQRRFRIYQTGGVPPESMLGPGILAFLANLAFTAALVALLAVVLGSLGVRLR
jgi:hypothetical protein